MKSVRSSIPNILSWSRLIISPVIVILAFFPTQRVAELVLITYGVISDKLDGTLARLWKVESEYGKKIESVADPLFSIAAALYVLLRTDFPQWVFWYGLMLFSINSFGRVVVYIATKKFFYQKSPITRYSTAVIFIAILLYIYMLPGRAVFLYFGVCYGTFTMLNYLYMEYRFIVHHRHTVRKPS